MNDRILAKLTDLEESHNMKILYACESGSRAWGFPSATSDYDVRFIFMRSPNSTLAQGLSWGRKQFGLKDQIDDQSVDSLDIVGWDLGKTLDLLAAGNPTLYEWLDSPIVYRKAPEITPIWDLAKACFSFRTARYHYWHMALGNWKKYLSDDDQVWVKKYFYVLRPLLSVAWLDGGFGSAPMAFSTLVNATVSDSLVRREIEALVAEKLAGVEQKSGPRRPVLDRFIDGMFSFLGSVPADSERAPVPYADLTSFYLATLNGS